MLSPKLMRLGPGRNMLGFWCPACAQLHVITVRRVEGYQGPVWDWNNNAERPTFSPSIKHDWGQGKVCHYFVREGRIQYCSDSTHDLAGQTVELPDVPEGWREL